MINFFKKGVYFVKENPNLLYSLFLIIVIPLALYYNTFFTVKSFQENIDFVFQTNALLIESIFAILSFDILEKPEILQEKIEQITKENPEISQLRISIPEENEKFKIIAAKDPGEIGREIKGDPIPLAWHKNQAIAYLGAKDKERFWEVIRPLQDSAGNKVGLVSMALSLKTPDLLITKAIHRSYLIVILAIFLTLFLIIHHTRLFKYPILLKKLQEVDKMKDDFIRMAIHELQSPIVNIRAYGESLKEEIGFLLSETQKESLSRMIISSERLSALIEDMLVVSRIEQGRISFLPQKISPPEIIEKIIEELKLKAKIKGIEIIFEKKEPAFIQVNPNRFREILYNLIDNAIKYTFKGKIEIITEVNLTKKRYNIIIQDSGIGMSAEAQKKLFEKFYRIKTKETADIPGTGLGLWIAKEMAKKMKGDILVESIEKVGSKFIVFFPLIE
jgi:signal transduction histidine kinase/coenzyme F420-reducing hydrogenase delta subunit